MQRLSIFNETPVIRNIIIINVIMFVITILIPIDTLDLRNVLGLHYFTTNEFKPWQIITHFFMHANFSHIFFNLFSLFSLGVLLEKIWGGKRFLLFYLVCGLGAAFVHQLAQAVQVYQVCHSFYFDFDMLSPLQQSKLSGVLGYAIGASGAIFGVFAAFALLFPNQELYVMFIPVPIKAKYVIGFLVFLDLYLGFTGSSLFGFGDNVAHFAHIGGALTGFIIVQLWKKDRTTFW